MSFYKNGVITSSNFLEIPNIYKRVEYIQSVGATQYINTAYPYYSTNNTYEIECDAEMISPNATQYQGFYGSYYSEAANTWRVIRANSDSAFYVYSNFKASSGGTTVSTSIYKRYKIQHNHAEVVLNGTSYPITAASGTVISGTINFFIFNGGNTATNSNMKLYYFALKDNGEYVRYMLPVKRVSDSVLGLYDTVNNVFYTNAGTGTFTAGADLGNNVGIYSDKVVSNNFIEI